MRPVCTSRLAAAARAALVAMPPTASAVLSPPTLGGAWSTSSHDAFINPQTQDFTLPAPKGKEK